MNLHHSQGRERERLRGNSSSRPPSPSPTTLTPPWKEMVAHKDNYLITSLSHSPRVISFYLLLITVINLGAWGEGKRGRRRDMGGGGWKRACSKSFSFLLLLSQLLQCASLLSPSLPLSPPAAQSASRAVLISPFHLPMPPALAPSLAPRQTGPLIRPDSEITPVRPQRILLGTSCGFLSVDSALGEPQTQASHSQVLAAPTEGASCPLTWVPPASHQCRSESGSPVFPQKPFPVPR